MTHVASRLESGRDRFRALHRKLEQAVSTIEQFSDVSTMLGSTLELFCCDFEEDLGFEGGRIYAREGDHYVLRSGFGTSRHAPVGVRVPRDYPPHRRLLTDGLVLMRRGEPGVDDQFERAIGVRSTFAAIGVGEGPSHIIAFSLNDAAREDDVLLSLSLVRHVINLKLRQGRLAGMVNAARILQEGILPQEPPQLGGFQIAAMFRPADLVSGDLYDYLPVSTCCVGLAIADSSGHGLPSAFLARDVITALRSTAGEGRSVPSIVTRVNTVIQHAALSGTFVTLFYGQLSEDGWLDYCNAGHELPLLLTAQGVRRLDVGGTVLGPIPTARYEGARVRLETGDTLILYTDGISERRNAAGDFLGVDRIERLVTSLQGQSAKAIATAVIEAADAFADGLAAQDDMTVVVVRRQDRSSV